MRSYQHILEEVIYKGLTKENRTGTDSLALPLIHWDHYLSDGFPLLTSRKLPIKVIAAELYCFLNSITSKGRFQKEGCQIWNHWANPEVVKESMGGATEENSDYVRKQIQYVTDDLGPIYGYQWRHFNLAYSENDDGCLTLYDQLKNIVDTLHNNPNDRRMVCLSWNPVQSNMMAVPPCQVGWNVTVIGGEIHLGWWQRSADIIFGVPFDIAQHAILLLLLAKESGLKPGKLSATFVDCHIYKNHLEDAYTLLDRRPRALPTLEVSSDEKWKDIYSWDYRDISLSGYNPHPHIDFGDIAV